jgi:GNAT superfamily N-acetyltransferase
MLIAEHQPIVIDRLQRYLRQTAQRQAEVLSVPPFTIVVRAGDSDQEAIAIPELPVGNGVRAIVPALQGAVPTLGHRLRFTFLAEFAPDLASVLQANGYEELARTQLLTCTASALRPAPAVPGLTLVTLDASSSLDDLREGLDANERGFDPAAAPTTIAAAEAFRRDLTANRAFTARLEGTPAGAGMFTPPVAGVAELVGITTLEPFRRQGIGAFLTAYAARTAFALGVDLVYLSTSNPAARRVYDRLGFRPQATQLTFGPPAGRRDA